MTVTKDSDFMIQQQRAVERMKEFAERSSNSSQNGMPVPPFVKLNGRFQNNDKPKESSPKTLDLKGINIPLLDKLKNDKDFGLILGILLLLICENSDKLTLIALLYILL